MRGSYHQLPACQTVPVAEAHRWSGVTSQRQAPSRCLACSTHARRSWRSQSRRYTGLAPSGFSLFKVRFYCPIVPTLKVSNLVLSPKKSLSLISPRLVRIPGCSASVSGSFIPGNSCFSKQKVSSRNHRVKGGLRGRRYCTLALSFFRANC